MGDAVANDATNQPGPFDIKTIRHLVALMSRHDLSEIDLREGELRIRLRRGMNGPIVTAALPATVPTSTPAASTPAPAPAAAESKTAPEKEYQYIRSPTPGTFYASPTPGAEPFVKAGSRVKPDTVVCLIEAMKIFNEITADCTGVIVEMLVENQQPVEYNTPLFKVDPTG
ncbi:MAG: acetyl-CoA carboxylase biotin carboxyl carrier protein [Gemmataceae bacterium]